MKVLLSLIKRHTKLFFKDKGMFITSLITPVILLVLYATFLADVYRDSFTSAFSGGMTIDASLIDGLVAGELLSSLLAVSCVTVSFCANMLMVTDKVTGARRDLTMSPIRASVLSLSYYIASTLTALIICLLTTVIGLLYVASVGWYMSVADVCLLVLDVFLLTVFGTAISSIVNFFLSTQGQISAVGTIVSAGYGFICGAYMPISSFPAGLQKVLSFLPGTYGTSLLRNAAMRGCFREMENLGFPAQAITAIRDGVDLNLYFSGDVVPVSTMYLVMTGSILILVGVYVLLNQVNKNGT